MKSRTLLIFISILIVSCSNSTKDNDGIDVISLEADDTKLKEFQKIAIDSLKFFTKEFNLHKDDSTYNFFIKTDFIEKGEHEHMWSDVKRINGDIFIGNLQNSPITLKNIKLGDSVLADKSTIEDWILNNKKSDKSIGGFSVNYLKANK